MAAASHIFRLVLCCLAVSASADDLTIHLPMTPVLTQPDEPTPVPMPLPITTVAAGQLYVVESSAALIPLQSPEGFLNVVAANGPLSVFGLFADGRTEPELRKYTSDHLLIVTGIKPGKTELILIPVGVTDQDSIVRQVLTVSGQGPQPPPNPIIDPVDPVDPTPAPGKLKVVIIEDPQSRASIPSEQIAVMDGQAIRQYAKTHCSMTGQTPDFRVLSHNQDVGNQPEWIKKAFAEPRSSLPFIVVSNGSTGAAGPLPTTESETLALLKKYGGE